MKTACTEEVNLSSISRAVNAFEKKDVSKFFISLPKNFGTVKEITFRTKGNKTESKTGSWYLDKFDAEIVSGDGWGNVASRTAEVKGWISSNSSRTCAVG